MDSVVFTIFVLYAFYVSVEHFDLNFRREYDLDMECSTFVWKSTQRSWILDLHYRMKCVISLYILLICCGQVWPVRLNGHTHTHTIPGEIPHQKQISQISFRTHCCFNLESCRFYSVEQRIRCQRKKANKHPQKDCLVCFNKSKQIYLCAVASSSISNHWIYFVFGNNFQFKQLQPQRGQRETRKTIISKWNWQHILLERGLLIRPKMFR